MSTVMEYVVAPERSLAQRMDALKHANEIRFARAEWKRDVKAGRTPAVAGLVDPPACLESMRVVDLLVALPKVGRVKANKALVRCRISPSKTLGGMTERQRLELAAWLGLRQVRGA